MPLDGSSWTQSFVLPGVASADRRSAKFTYVSPQYFRTVGMRITNGRDIDDGDTQLGRRVVLVNETFVRRYLASRPAIGAVLKTIPEPGYPETLYEVVGVVTDAKYSALREPTPPATFVPLAQHPNLRPWPGIVIRSAVPPEQAIGALRRAVADVRPRMAVGVSVFETQVADSLMRERSLAWLAGGFGATAALLAIVGVYGVLAYLVRRRRQEIAIRLALGARPANVVVLVLREMLTLLAIGVAAGGLSAAALGGASSFLFGVSPRDPATLLAVIGALAIVAVIAALVPAVRASRIDATAALRAE
jgi:putative ABC transport system permease protein